MLDFAIFAVTAIVVLIVAIIYMYPSSRKVSTIPGLDSTSAQDGNIVDIQRAGSLHQFLQKQHANLGPIISFWIGDEFVVSLASPSLFKQHLNVFDRPGDLYRIVTPVFGAKSILFLNGAEGRARRQLYDKALQHDNLEAYVDLIHKISAEMSTKWASLVKEEHVGLQQYMTAFAAKVVLRCVAGDYYTDDKEVLNFVRNYDHVWSELEHRGRDPDLPASESPRAVQFTAALKELQSSVDKALAHRAKTRPAKDTDFHPLIIDHVLALHGSDKSSQAGECLTFILTGISRVASMLTWCFYFLASHAAVQEKLCSELVHEYQGSGDTKASSILRLKYVRQVLEETLRCAVVTPWTARFQDFDTEIGGHKIPKNTAVIHALGVVMQDEKLFDVPNRFDPDRFNAENSRQRDTLAFTPFGFAGKRQCLARDWTYLAAGALVAALVKRFTVQLVPGQVVRPSYGLVTQPEDEVWITVHKRK